MPEIERNTGESEPGGRASEGLLLTVIVPVRDDERSVAACVRSLAAQSEPGWELGRHWELLVIDDSSQDHTAERAREAGAVVTRARVPLPHGWTAEANALWTGAEQARGTWLLFTRADAVHASGSLSRSIIEAERNGVALLSWGPQETASGWLERALMPLVSSEIATAYPADKVNEPGKRVAFATDRFLLVKAEALVTLGGMARVAESMISAVDLAFAAKKDKHVGLRFRYAPEMVQTAAPGRFDAYWAAHADTLALLLPSALALALWRLLDIALLWGLPLVAVLVLPTVGWNSPALHLYQVAVGLFWLRTLIRIGRRSARSHMPVGDLAWAMLLGLPLFAVLCSASWYRARILRRVA